MATKIANILTENFDLEKVLVSNLVQQEIEKKSEIGKFSLEKLAKNESSIQLNACQSNFIFLKFPTI